MEWFTKAFIKASVAWLSLGATLGIAMAVHPSWSIYRTAHLHIMLLGFVAGMIFGVAYHVVPRFTGHPLRSARLAGAHWWLTNVGLALMVAGFALRASASGGFALSTLVLGTGGTMAALGAYAFAYNIWMTIEMPSGSSRAPLRTAAPRQD